MALEVLEALEKEEIQIMTKALIPKIATLAVKLPPKSALAEEKVVDATFVTGVKISAAQIK